MDLHNAEEYVNNLIDTGLIVDVDTEEKIDLIWCLAYPHYAYYIQD